ncbi:hypothetical protein Pla110_33010 [Polystyrenella longa]|uniref:Phage gp6-like head-tail connector protein n=1 Tax=Polystyrenella longa TaxID=2528007 RepID=A0A518CQQ4_9PLAN|nr:phage gp6-like head-tail connector protein [Polystyrenella longa]QDU81559.1 hypothetical protein Pla110_33010 [Polystyrenella longa]
MTLLIDKNNPLLNKFNVGSADVGTLTACIKSASSAIENYCGRTFSAIDHDESVTPGQYGQIILEHFPVNYLTGVYDSINSNAILIKCTATTSSYSVRDDYLHLTSTTSGVTTTNSLSFSDYPSLTSLSNAITELNGWTATTTVGNYASDDLVKGQYSFVTSSNTGISLWEFCTGDIDVHLERGIIGTHHTNRPMRVKYNAGFSSIPDDLKSVTANLVGFMLDEKNGGIKSERLGEYNYTLADNSIDRLPIMDKQILKYYRNRRV